MRRTRRRSSGSASSAGAGGAGKICASSHAAPDVISVVIARGRPGQPWISAVAPARARAGGGSSARRCFSARSGRRGGRRRRRRACGAGGSAPSACSSRSRPVRPSSCWRRRSNPIPARATVARRTAGGPGRGCGVGAPFLVGPPAGAVARRARRLDAGVRREGPQAHRQQRRPRGCSSAPPSCRRRSTSNRCSRGWPTRSERWASTSAPPSPTASATSRPAAFLSTGPTRSVCTWMVKRDTHLATSVICTADGKATARDACRPVARERSAGARPRARDYCWPARRDYGAGETVRGRTNTGS